MALVKESNLRGRGGAGFPTAQKWSFEPRGTDRPRPKFLIINADEMEPGTFKDRLLLEGNPHGVIEGALISAYALQSDIVYIFLRWEYRRAAATIERAIAEAYSSGYLGKGILGKDFALEMKLHVSAGLGTSPYAPARFCCRPEASLLTLTPVSNGDAEFDEEHSLPQLATERS